MRNMAIGCLIALSTLVGCTHMDNIVKEVRFNKDGDLVVLKCDAKIFWNFYFVAWGEGDCREEVKPKPAKS
jgi:hypothetical protein